MNRETKDYISSLNRDCLPWHRMITAYGTAKKYNDLLDILEQTLDVENWEKCFEDISDFEHQGTMFPPVPFVLVNSALSFWLLMEIKKYLTSSSSR